jgi:chaperonin GroEL
VAHKKLRFDTEARQSIEAGVNKLADAVRTTLGPKGLIVTTDAVVAEPPAGLGAAAVTRAGMDMDIL